MVCHHRTMTFYFRSPLKSCRFFFFFFFLHRVRQCLSVDLRFDKNLYFKTENGNFENSPKRAFTFERISLHPLPCSLFCSLSSFFIRLFWQSKSFEMINEFNGIVTIPFRQLPPPLIFMRNVPKPI